MAGYLGSSAPYVLYAECVACRTCSVRLTGGGRCRSRRSSGLCVLYVQFVPLPAGGGSSRSLRSSVLCVLFTGWGVCLTLFRAFGRRRQQQKSPEPATVMKPLMCDVAAPAAHTLSDPVELRRQNFQTPGMVSHPPIHVSQLADHLDALKAGDNANFSEEYEVRRWAVVDAVWSLENNPRCWLF